MADPYLRLYTNCGNLMSLLSEEIKDSRSELFQFGSCRAAFGKKDEFIGGRKCHRGRRGKAGRKHLCQHALEVEKMANLAVESLQLGKPVDEQADTFAGHG